MNTAIIVSAGSGKRSQLNTNKNLFMLDGCTVIEKTVSAFLSVESINEVIVVVPYDLFDNFADILLKLSPKIKLVVGGSTRKNSVKNALEICSGDYVLIHDGARPFVSKNLIEKCLYMSVINDNCIPVTPLKNTVGVIENDRIIKTARADLLSLQTPQTFKTQLIKKAYELSKDDQSFTDDCGIYCKFIGPCYYIEGEEANIKLTTKKDFEDILPNLTGIGFDLHKLVENRKLILGGVEIPFRKGLLGHSDADVVIHALMDSMLSAVGLKDIGYYFPDTDIRYKDISSTILLQKVLDLVEKQGYKPVNASICIMAEKPKLLPFVDDIKSSIAKHLNIHPQQVGITCTTLEGVGIIGKEEAIASYATCLLSHKL